MRKIKLLLETINTVIHHARWVKTHYGKSFLAQFKEFLALRSSSSGINPVEYYEFRLFTDDKTLEEKKEYIGWKIKDKTITFCDSRWSLPMRDKILQQVYLEQLGLPYPKIKATCGPFQRYLGNTPSFKPDTEFVDFLRKEITYPFFSKPIAASMGRDGISIHGFDDKTESLLLGSGEKLSIKDYLKLIEEEERGTLLQEQVISHPDIVEFFGDRLASVRIVTLLFKDKPKIFRAALKIPTGNNMTDNFSCGKTGNLLAQINLESGIIEKVFKGVGLEQEFVYKHPDTGKHLEGFQIPDWQLILDTTLLATRAVPGLYLQNWDVAIGANGPVILELNFPGDIEHLQHALGKGINDDDFKRMLEDWNVSGLITQRFLKDIKLRSRQKKKKSSIHTE